MVEIRSGFARKSVKTVTGCILYSCDIFRFLYPLKIRYAPKNIRINGHSLNRKEKPPQKIKARKIIMNAGVNNPFSRFPNQYIIKNPKPGPNKKPGQRLAILSQPKIAEYRNQRFI